MRVCGHIEKCGEEAYKLHACFKGNNKSDNMAEVGVVVGASTTARMPRLLARMRRFPGIRKSCPEGPERIRTYVFFQVESPCVPRYPTSAVPRS